MLFWICQVQAIVFSRGYNKFSDRNNSRQKSISLRSLTVQEKQTVGMVVGTCEVQEACGIPSLAIHRSGSRGQLTWPLSHLPPAARPYFLKRSSTSNMAPQLETQVFKPMSPWGSFTVKPQQTSISVWRLQRQQVDICRNLELVGEH